jgi:hypothetical protein
VEIVKNEKVKCVVKRIEDILKKKLKEVEVRKAELVKLGKFKRKERMKIIDEKMEYEYVIVGRIDNDVKSCEDGNSELRKKIVD